VPPGAKGKTEGHRKRFSKDPLMKKIGRRWPGKESNWKRGSPGTNERELGKVERLEL